MVTIPINLRLYRVLGRNRIEPAEWTRKYNQNKINKLVKKVYLN
jgi:hypothetical protein